MIYGKRVHEVMFILKVLRNFTHYSSVVNIFYNTSLSKSAVSTYSFRKLIFSLSVFYVFFVCCVFRAVTSFWSVPSTVYNKKKSFLTRWFWGSNSLQPFKYKIFNKVFHYISKSIETFSVVMPKTHILQKTGTNCDLTTDS